MNALENTLAPLLMPLSSLRLFEMPRATRLALEMLDRLEGGALAIELPQGVRVRAGHGPLVAHLQVRSHAVFDDVLARGDIGFAESWMDEQWSTDDLAALLTLLSRNRPVLASAIHGRVLRLIGHRLTHLLRANTRSAPSRSWQNQKLTGLNTKPITRGMVCSTTSPSHTPARPRSARMPRSQGSSGEPSRRPWSRLSTENRLKRSMPSSGARISSSRPRGRRTKAVG